MNVTIYKDVEKVEKWQFFELFQIRPKVCESKAFYYTYKLEVWLQTKIFTPAG